MRAQRGGAISFDLPNLYSRPMRRRDPQDQPAEHAVEPAPPVASADTDLDVFAHLCREKAEADRQSAEEIVKAFRRLLKRTESPELRSRAVMAALGALEPGQLPEEMLRYALKLDTGMAPVSSFRRLIPIRRQRHHLGPFKLEGPLERKAVSARFAELCGIRVPASSLETRTLDELELHPGYAFKPTNAAGARGVMLCFEEQRVFRPKEQLWTDWGESVAMSREMLDEGRIETDEWVLEELVEDVAEQGPARDVKFYCFYGRVGLVLEIVRDPETRHCWWSRDGERIATGKYGDSAFAGVGVSDADVEMVERFSAEIPAPFMRIDFLHGRNGLVFGEMGAKPARYDRFDDETDRWLGDLWLEAEGRLLNDALAGQRFEALEAAQAIH
ncbi:hypothetical protein ER308_15505 [Egibacter rhizosphaerae]|uniref:ATP-grasp domain-containing protein n=1 Tax=Egibacter rhizosphaerae TaxID=1670831 RepID=A0A411YHZ1_9ACTN|nr:ATP-grasp fold amidoligase family protein [Egibacter rhizosphaerae]QBI20837.1 hypothetical protein ER308_15505 [Egibacter rhizosphaerae]